MEDKPVSDKTWKSYVGSKLIKARQEREDVYFYGKGPKANSSYPEPPMEGYDIRYPDGTGAWREKEMFEAAYKEVALPEERSDIKYPDDPWANRSEGMRCKTCMWFVPKAVEALETLVDTRGVMGRCRKNAPELGGFPVVFEKDWCGNHKLK